jgi:hypothetical protein
MNSEKAWYVVKLEDGHCKIMAASPDIEANKAISERWGPFDSPEIAIARRVGLIRAGKCQPIQPNP